MGGPLFGGGPLDDIPLKKGSTISTLSQHFTRQQTNYIHTHTIGSVLLREQVKKINSSRSNEIRNHHSPQVINCKNKGETWNLLFNTSARWSPHSTRTPSGPAWPSRRTTTAWMYWWRSSTTRRLKLRLCGLLYFDGFTIQGLVKARVYYKHL